MQKLFYLLRLHGLIERQPHSNRYRVTEEGTRIILLFIRAETCFFRVTFAIDQPQKAGVAPSVLIHASQAIDRFVQEVKLAA
jgi:hypothetical protein